MTRPAETGEMETALRRLPNKVYLKQCEVISATDWTIYFLRQLEQAQILVPLQYRSGAHRRYPRSVVVKLLREMEGGA